MLVYKHCSSSFRLAVCAPPSILVTPNFRERQYSRGASRMGQATLEAFVRGAAKRPAPLEQASRAAKQAKLDPVLDQVATPASAAAVTGPVSSDAAAAASTSPGSASPAAGVTIASVATPAAEPKPVPQGPLIDLLTEPSWRAALRNELAKPSFTQLQDFLSSEWRTQQIFPPKDSIFRAMNSCPLSDVRVVIIGQDPYHNDGQAMGLSFSVPPGQPIPSSLKNIFKELKDDCGCSLPNHGSLEHWAKQGVLLLNTVLTVRAHTANSHAKKGWEAFTDAAIRAISLKREGVVFLLWGKPAQQKGQLINPLRHHTLTSFHPSGLSASRGFFGCKHFSKTNALLAKAGMPQVDWQIPSV
ncbi:hypothetical protein WJX84_007021 [Apatococcus fuscideae]|uniref:Uracil-DNA glycosylase n=1 Tax=Apatococcus fuscideae TaxID=2026836 RepID=A0AAW1TGI1_9CHLO